LTPVSETETSGRGVDNVLEQSERDWLGAAIAMNGGSASVDAYDLPDVSRQALVGEADALPHSEVLLATDLRRRLQRCSDLQEKSVLPATKGLQIHAAAPMPTPD